MTVTAEETALKNNLGETIAEDPRYLLSSSLAEFAARGAHEFDDPTTREATLEAASHLSAEFGIRPAFFENPARTLVFLAAANEFAQEGEAHKERALDSIHLLSKGFVERDLGLTEAKKLSDAEQAAITDRYTDQELSGQLRQYIGEAGIFEDIAQKVGDERPYDLRVLDIASEETEYGLGIDWPEDETAEKLREWSVSNDKLDIELAKLKENESQLRRELGVEADSLPMAWMHFVEGKPILYIHKSTAYKILGAEGKVRQDYAEEDRSRDIALLRHEYVHTQNFYGLNAESLAGITLEERRAELLSGDHHGYIDVKGFFDDIKSATGVDTEALLTDHAAESDASALYLELAKRFGVSTMLEIAMVLPNKYTREAEAKGGRASSELQRKLWGYTAVADRIAEKFGDESLINAYADDMAKRLHVAEMDPETWAGYFSGGDESSTVKKRVVARYNELFSTESTPS